MPRDVRRPTVADLDAAWRVVSAWLPATPVLPADGRSPALKLETAQPTGAFKVRGALAALSALAAVEPARSVVTASAGNHALGVAYAASRLGLQATVVTATTASPAKVAAIRRWGVDLVQVGTTYDDAEAHALALAGRGAHYLSAYNDPAVVAGQGTIGRELEGQVAGPLTVVCPVGGGGLAAGLGLWASGRADVRVVGVEAAHNPAVAAAVAAGEVVDVELLPTVADGVAGGLEPGSVTVPVVAETLAGLVTVSEDEIRAAMRHLALERGVVAEGAGAVGVAAVLAGKVAAEGAVLAVVSGRNVTASLLADVLTGRPR